MELLIIFFVTLFVPYLTIGYFDICWVLKSTNKCTFWNKRQVSEVHVTGNNNLLYQKWETAFNHISKHQEEGWNASQGHSADSLIFSQI